MIKQCVESSLIYSDIEKWDCVIKKKGMLSFLPVINKWVTIRLRILLQSISEMIWSNTVNVFRYLFGLYSSIFL